MSRIVRMVSLLYGENPTESPSIVVDMEAARKTLVLYVFHVYNERVRWFIDHAMFEDPSIDWLIICNHPGLAFPHPAYATVIYRENKGVDFGAWSDGLLTGERYKAYTHFIFVNSSVIGPFVPAYFKGRWTDIFLDGLTDTVKLFGSTINTIREPTRLAHVQSYAYAMGREALEYLIQRGLYTQTFYASSILEAVMQFEIPLSRFILERGWNIGCCMPYYKGVDFTFKERTPESYRIAWLDDCMYPNGYFGKSLNPYDVVFLKGNRYPANTAQQVTQTGNAV